MNKLFWLAFFLVSFVRLYAQNTPETTLLGTKTTKPIVLDGKLDDEAWQNAQRAKDFYQNFPFDSSYAEMKTEIMVCFDEQNVYFAFICHDNYMDKPFVVQSLRRDFNGGRNDFITVYMDTFGDGANGFTFGITPLGVEREGLMSDGGNINSDWDNKWYSQAKIYEDKWVAELAIPFKSIRYKGGKDPWQVNFARIDYKINENSSWIPVPRNFDLNSLAFTGKIIWEEALPKAGANIALIPYITGGFNQNQLENTPTEYTFNAGGDAKVAVTSSLNLDLTFNPDFSQVEVDRQVTNLDRFEIFFPERRQFFLENADLFARFGFSRIRPFFSRRIGIGIDTATNQVVQTPILFGARLSGKVNQNWRVGLLNMQTQDDQDRNIDGQNYTVAAFQRKMFARSNLGMIFVNRENTSQSDTEGKDFNRVIGIDYNLASKNNRWLGKFFYHQDFTEDQKPEQYAHASFLRYADEYWSFNWNHEYVGENYQADVGFVPRRDHWRLEPSAFRRFFPKKQNAKVNNHRIGFYTNFFWDTDGNWTDMTLRPQYRISFNNTAFFSSGFNRDYIRLFSDFDPTNTDGVQLLSGEEFFYNSMFIEYGSDRRKLLSWRASSNFGGYFNGDIYRIEGEINYRFQPYVTFQLAANYTRIELPEPYNDADLLLISPRVDATFTKNLFLTVFLQYNNQIENINLNARLQWRFKPVSDIFLVYTDNYFPETLRVKNRALVFKMTYWLNI